MKDDIFTRFHIGETVEYTREEGDSGRGTVVYIDEMDPGIPWAITLKELDDSSEESCRSTYLQEAGTIGWEWFCANQVWAALHVIDEVPV